MSGFTKGQYRPPPGRNGVLVRGSTPAQGSVSFHGARHKDENEDDRNEPSPIVERFEPESGSEATLRLSADLLVPPNIVTQKLAFLGRTGSGKTFAATKTAELMLEAGAQVIALDPVGKWYGLRLAGTGAPFSILVFGGLSGDLELDPTSGTAVADVVVDRGLSVVLDVSQMLDAEKARFAADFAARFFYRKKAAPSAVHVFLEEAQEFVPQNPERGEERMLSAFNRISKLGRNFGIGCSLISQRPQEVNKKALNMSECLFVFQMTGPQERKAIEAWVSDKGLDHGIVDILPKLAEGDAHVWSPTWLKVSKTLRVLPKRSADVSFTPRVGVKAEVVQALSPIDLGDLQKAIETTGAEKGSKSKGKVLPGQTEEVKALRQKLEDQAREIRDLRSLGTGDFDIAIVKKQREIIRELENKLADALGRTGDVRLAGRYEKTLRGVKDRAEKILSKIDKALTEAE